MPAELILYIIIALFGIVIGSFLNVLILRIPLGQEFVKTPSHCMSCGHNLAWYDNIPLFSWLTLGGKCRYCKAPISCQYPIIEAANGLIYVIVFLAKGFTVTSVLLCLMSSALLALSVIDVRTYEIPDGFQIYLGVLGVINVLLHLSDGTWLTYGIGFFAVSVLLEIIFRVSKGTAIGGGDVKLMAVTGLILGWQNILLAFFIGCLLGSIIHLLRMRLSGVDHVLAMGPYLSVGIFLAALFGSNMISWYLSFF